MASGVYCNDSQAKLRNFLLQDVSYLLLTATNQYGIKYSITLFPLSANEGNEALATGK